MGLLADATEFSALLLDWLQRELSASGGAAFIPALFEGGSSTIVQCSQDSSHFSEKPECFMELRAGLSPVAAALEAKEARCRTFQQDRKTRGPTGYGICPRPASAGSNSTRSGSRPSSPVGPDIFASPKTPRPRHVRTHRFEKTDRFAPDEPFWGTVKRRPASARREDSSLPTQAAEPSNQQLLEIVPAEVREKVKSTAGSGALVIEMLWSSSSYLPAHDNGRKYMNMASELVDLMAGRLSKGEPFRVLTIEEPVKVKKGLYDKFSERQRSSGALASNVSHANGTASRVGAFEVHLLQDVWQAKLCSASANHHQGPPVITSNGVLCAACAASSAASGSLGLGELQHLLLHSKLWTRRWPSLYGLVALTGALVIEAPPEVPRPVVIRHLGRNIRHVGGYIFNH
eukprot:s188_g1.t1